MEGNIFRGFSIDNNLFVSLMKFSDDTVIFCDGGDSTLLCLKAVLQSFELVYGLKISYVKCNLVGVNIEERIFWGASAFIACGIGKISLQLVQIREDTVLGSEY